MPFADPEILRTVASMPSAAFVGRHHIHENYSFDGRGEGYRAIFEADADPTALWTSDDGRYSVNRPSDPRFEIPATSMATGPDFEPATTVLLRHAGATVGFYSGGMAWIDLAHRGLRLAPKMILAGCIAAGGVVYDNTATMGFSKSGYAAHLAAHREAVALFRGAS